MAGEAISVDARILAIADAYDAMTSERSYRDAMGHDDALAELVGGAGTQFDPASVHVFAALELAPANDALVPVLDFSAQAMALLR